MSKFNKSHVTAPAPTHPIVGDHNPTGTTFEGAPGYARDAKSELFLLAVTNMVSEDTFYEKANARDDRFVNLVRHVAVVDYAWFRGFVGWLRNEANMRTASVVAVVEGAKALLDAKVGGGRLLFEALSRADEPGEALAYWVGNYGRRIPKPIKRGLADAVVRLYTERSFLKWDSARAGFRFADVIELVHPAPGSIDQRHQDVLFRYILDDRRGRIDPEMLPALPMIRMNKWWHEQIQETPEQVLHQQILRGAGLTWEDVLSALGNKVDKKVLWEALIPTMGYMALLRNLRNFDQAGVSDAFATQVLEKLTNLDEVKASRQFPFRFLAAYRNAPSLRWGHGLERALNLSLANLPELPGKTLILVDRSGSMFYTMSGKSELTRADAAALFGTALALRNPGRVDLVQFGTDSRLVQVSAGESVLRVVDTKFANLGGTNTAMAVARHFNGHDRVVIITDEQTSRTYGYSNRGVSETVPVSVPMYTWNLAGYRYGHAPSGSENRYTFGGLNDVSFKLVQMLERGRDASWPWENQ